MAVASPLDERMPGSPWTQSVIPSEHLQQLSEPKQKELQWKYVGYPGLATWMASSPDFFTLRRFDYLQARVLLTMQDLIAEKEEELRKIDMKRANAQLRLDDKYLFMDESMNGSVRSDPDEERMELLEKIQHLLREYNDHVNSYSALRARHTVDNRRYESLVKWFKNNKNALLGVEADFVKEQGDLISITDRPKMPITTLLDRWITGGFVQNWSIFKPRSKAGHGKLVKADTVQYFSTAGTDAFLTAVIVFLGLGLLIGPLFWLNAISDSTKRLEIITGFLLLFTALFIGVKSNGAFEILAAAAAYAAVLMVFLQVQSNSGNDS